MKIICVGHNYRDHNLEMGRDGIDLASVPIVFLKPDSALLKDNKPFYIPDFSSSIHYEGELVVRINRLGKNIAERFAYRYYEELTLGVDFTARDLQNDLKDRGLPWELSKGFDCSAVVGTFVSKNRFENGVKGIEFELHRNGDIVQRGNSDNMIHPVDWIVSYVSRFFTLKIGDIIFTGTPAGVGCVEIGDHLEGFVEGDKLFDFYIR